MSDNIYTDMGGKETGKRILAKDFTVSNNTMETQLNNNDLLIGPSGSGKTGGYVIPNIQEIVNNNSSMIVADTKNRLSRDYKEWLESNGYRVYTVDFVHPESSSAYNPLDYVRFDPNTGKYSEQDIMTVANALVSDDQQDPFWSQAAKTVVACFISFVLEAFPDDNPNLSKVVDMYNLMISQIAALDHVSTKEVRFLEEWYMGHRDSFAVKNYLMFKGVLATDTTWGCITQFVTNALYAFEFDEAKTLFAVERPTDFKLWELGREKMVVFLNISDSDRTFDNLINLFYTQALQALIKEADDHPENNGRLGVPVRIILDDFAANARIPDFDKTISVIRSRAISVSIILQSLTQLNTLYSQPAAMTIVNNCDHVVYLGGSDLETARYVAYRVDKSVQTVLSTPLDKVWIMERGKKGMLRDRFEPYSTAPQSR